MGRFFANLQIRKNVNQSQSDFLKTFTAVMKKLGYVKTEADEAELSYVAAFSSSKQWITLCAEDYVSNAEKVNTDAQKIAANLKTFCISNTVIDSDVAVLDMYVGQEECADRVVIGYGEAYGLESREEAKGNRELWEPLMVDDNLWDKFSETQSSDFTFAEDGLVEISELLGISPDLITADYGDLSSVSEDNKAIVPLYFKKAGAKTLSLNAAFVKVFGEALEPLGFKKIKGRHPYLVRVVPGGEIIHVITCMAGHDNSFEILGGVATIYRPHISLDKNVKENCEWLKNNLRFYEIYNPLENDFEFRQSIHHFYYYDNKRPYIKGTYTPNGKLRKSLLDVIEEALAITKKIMFPILDNVITLEDCVNFFDKFNMTMWIFDNDDINSQNSFYDHNEGLLLIKTNRIDFFKNKQKDYLDKKYDESLVFGLENQIKLSNNIFNDSEKYVEILKEIECRQKANMQFLKTYILD